MKGLCWHTLCLILLEFWIFLSLLKRGTVDDLGLGKEKGDFSMTLHGDSPKIGRNHQWKRPLEQEGSRHPVMGVEQLKWTQTGSLSGEGGGGFDSYDVYTSLSLGGPMGSVTTRGKQRSSPRTSSGLTRSWLSGSSYAHWGGGQRQVRDLSIRRSRSGSRGGHQDGQEHSGAQKEPAW